MSFNFFKNFGKVQGKRLEESAINLAVLIDSDGVSEAAILQKEDEFKKLSSYLADAKKSYSKEKEEYESELATYTRFMAEAEAIQKLLSGTPENKDELESDLDKIVQILTKAKPKLQKEKEEYESADQYMREMQDAVSEISDVLVTLRETVESAKLENKKAEIELERNRKQLEQAQILAGLKTSSNKFDVALNALNSKADKTRTEAEELKIQADSLKQSLSKTKVDDLLGKYSTKPVLDTESVSDKLAKLKL